MTNRDGQLLSPVRHLMIVVHFFPSAIVPVLPGVILKTPGRPTPVANPTERCEEEWHRSAMPSEKLLVLDPGGGDQRLHPLRGLPARHDGLEERHTVWLFFGGFQSP